jgi:ATP-dependent Lon protease
MKLPIFPLGLVLFPGEILSLHIFEPRYRQLINDCVAEGFSFGIPPFIEGKISAMGTEADLLSIHRIYHHGEMDVSVQGRRIFQISKIYANHEGKLYAGADVEWIEYDKESDLALTEKIVAMLAELYAILHISEAKVPKVHDFFSFDIAHFIGLSIEQEYKLLGIRKEKERQQFIYAHLLKIIPVIRETEVLKQRIRSNGHFNHPAKPEK